MAGKRMTRRAPFRIAYEGDGDEDEYDDGEDDGDGAGGAVPGGRGKRLAALLALKGLKGHGGNRSREKSQAINLRAHLLSMDKEALVALLLEQAKADDALRERLDLSAAVANPDGVDLASLRRRIDKALELPYFDYDNPYWDEEDPYEGYADQMKPVLSALETLLEKGGAASVAALAEYALTGLNKQCREMEYDFVESGEVVRPLAELHARACAVTKPDPHVLADWLFRFGVRDSADYFGCLPWEKYGPALGKAGLDHFRRLIEKEWKGIPALKTPAGTDSHWLLRSRLQEIVMRFAREDGDVDAQAEAAKKDLSEADGYLAVAWSEFAEHPDLDGYRELKKQAEKEKAWPSWRAKAFELIREAVAAAKKKGNKRRTGTGGWAPPCYGIYPGDNHSLLVEILLWEGKPEEAWREAEAGDCSEDLWLRLAAWREKRNPRDCLPIWRRRVERLTQRADQHDYVPAAESLAKLGELMTRTGAGGEFAAYMRTIRSELGRRRNFISELDRRKLP